METVISPIDRTDIAARTWVLAFASVASLMVALDACCLPSTAGAQLYKLAKPDIA